MTAPTIFVIVATFDNTDPQVFGPFATRALANDHQRSLWAELADNHHLETVITREVRPA
jgi:hypothetical protein